LPETCHMAEFRVKHQEQIVRMWHLETPGLNLLELFSMHRDQSTHCITFLPSKHLHSSVSPSPKVIGCHLTLFQRFTLYQQEISSLGVDWLPSSSVSCRLTKRCAYFKYGAGTSIVIIIACIKALEISHGSCI